MSELVFQSGDPVRDLVGTAQDDGIGGDEQWCNQIGFMLLVIHEHLGGGYFLTAVDGAVSGANLVVIEAYPENPFCNEGVLVRLAVVVLDVIVEENVDVILVHHGVVGEHSGTQPRWGRGTANDALVFVDGLEVSQFAGFVGEMYEDGAAGCLQLDGFVQCLHLP